MTKDTTKKDTQTTRKNGRKTQRPTDRKTERKEERPRGKKKNITLDRDIETQQSKHERHKHGTKKKDGREN